MEVKIKKMKNIKEKKDQLTEELQEMHEKVAELEKIVVRDNHREKELQQSDEKLQKFVEGIAYIITEIVEIRDPYLRGHHQRVSKLGIAIARR